jgi:hypothetical protein
MQTASKTRKQSEIKSAAIFHCTAKKSFTEKCFTIEAGEKFYRVNSDTENDSYIVVYKDEWQCSCQCGIETAHRVTCKHIRAVNSVLKAKFQIGREKQQAEIKASEQQVSTPAPTPVKTEASKPSPEFLERQRFAELCQGNLQRADEMKQAIEARKREEAPLSSARGQGFSLPK